MPSVHTRHITSLIITLTLFCPLIFSSCTTAPEPSPLMREMSDDPVISAKQLRMLINEFVAQFSGRIEEAADQIMILESSPEIRQNTVLWKINAIAAAFRSASLEDPLAAVIDLRVLSIQMINFFETGAGKDAFGDSQPIAMAASRDIEIQILKIAAMTSAREEGVRKVEEWADSLARESPIESMYFTRHSFLQSYSQFMEEGGAGLFKSLVDLTESLSVLKDLLIMYAENLPNQARWQVELLLIDLRLATTTSDIRERLSKMALATDKLSDAGLDLSEKLDETKETVFADLHREWELALNDIDELRVETLQHITGERVALVEALDKEVNLILSQVTTERKAALRDIEAVSLRISEELLNRGAEKADRLLMKAFWLGVALAVIVFVLVLLGAAILRRGRQEKA